MCGIVGYFARGGRTVADGTLQSMASCLRHRGPDAGGVWRDETGAAGLGHRRLAIVDLSDDGAQPMESASGRFRIVFNGEIYNYRRLAEDLRTSGCRFRGHSDTEVMLAAIERWGVHAAVQRFVGIFAFGLWDAREHVMHLVRDHIGVKPLYYAWVDDVLVFGSELKALRRFPGHRSEIDRSALTLLLRHNCIPAPYSVYQGTRKLRPGTVLSVPMRGDVPEPVPFWSARHAAEQGTRDPLTLDDDALVAQLDGVLRDAVGLQMLADVPLGAFLSGGIDSSTVVALMQAQSAHPVRTFSIGFDVPGYDEAGHARAVAAHLGTAHTELYVSAEDALRVIPSLPTYYDEPFADSSQIPTHLVSRLARQSVTVALSGDGGDELFAGYNRHVLGESLWRRLRMVPLPIRQLSGRVLRRASPDTVSRLLRLSGRVLGTRDVWGYHVQKLTELVDAASPAELYQRLASHWMEPETIVLGGVEPPSIPTDPAQWAVLPSFTEQMMFLDLVTYMPDDILTKLDRASMAVALEARVPLLDHRVVEFAWRIPLHQKLRQGVSKWALRQVLYQYVPPRLIDRPKAGFGMPIGDWLRGPLRPWAEDLLSEDRLRADGFFAPEPIRQTWAEHLSGRGEWQYHLWTVLMFQAWYHAEATG